ncbi:MAG: efflux RND transporter periplasmic adaptor subunit [Bacteroidales bacterium]
MKKLLVHRLSNFYKSLLVSRRIAFVAFIVMFIFVACDNNNEQKGDVEDIRQKITEYNEQIVELNQKVSELERELEALGEIPQNRLRTPVTVMKIQPQPFDKYFNVNASVEPVQYAMISPETSGQIKEIFVEKGQRVKRDQELARLNTNVIENNISEVKTSLQLAQTVYNRQKSLWEQEIGSEIQFLEARNNYESLQSRLKTLESQLDMAVMTAPFDGIVDDIFTKEGELAMPGNRVMQMINLDNLYINADVSESFLPDIDPDDQVILRFPAYPDYEERFPIHRLGNVINPENRTFRLQLRINNRDQKFKPNMVASMSIPSFSTDDALVIPSILIKQDLQGHYVFTVTKDENEDWIANKTYIERGPAGEGKTMIISGISIGDLIIDQGHNRVNDGTLISIPSEMTAITNK